MIRKIIHIDEEKCNGCGLCATACHEGAIDIINGKAKLVRENFCDGFGDCLPGCPTGAITFEEREAPAYDEAAVQENKKKKELQEKMKHLHEGGCPGSRMRMLEQPEAAESAASAPVQPVSRLRNWPVQIKLVPVNAPYFDGAKLLIAGDTLFRRGIGRTDLWGGDYPTIERSIRQRLYCLDEDATVVTGHGPDTRLGDEMRENPFIRA